MFHNQIVKFLLPYDQFGINVPGGTDFVIHSKQSVIDHYCHNHTKSTCLDLVNMFNEVSHKACDAILASNCSLSPIIHFSIFSILTKTLLPGFAPTHIWDTIIL
jgi:hypothetical protein